MVNKSIFRVQRLRRTFFCTDVSGCKSQKNKGDPNLMTQNKNIWSVLYGIPTKIYGLWIFEKVKWTIKSRLFGWNGPPYYNSPKKFTNLHMLNISSCFKTRKSA